MKARILVVDDDPGTLASLTRAFALEGYTTLTASSAATALRILENESVDAVLSDVVMPDMDGLELIQLIRKTRPASKIIAISGGSGERNYLDAAKFLGAHDTLKKPLSLQELLDTVASQLI